MNLTDEEQENLDRATREIDSYSYFAIVRFLRAVKERAYGIGYMRGYTDAARIIVPVVDD